MTNPSKPQATYAPECPWCPEMSFVIEERHHEQAAGDWVSLTMTCPNGHAWVCEYLVVPPRGVDS